MKYALLLLAGASFVASAACNSTPASLAAPSATGTASSAENRAALPTIAGIAVSNPNFTTLVAALSKAGLVETFSGNGHYTVFAPTNAAFDAAAAALVGPGATGLDLVEALDVPTLTAVLSYHVTRGDRSAQSVLASGTLRMLDGNAATVTTDGGARINNAAIGATDIRASNGLIHVIDAVLLPPAN